ncbi:MAG: HD domain-containing phosphohydrolase [Pseudanabaenaceae cyanobacterium bins.68]|nr:HD domain-containing phosphohydrolase [Pseudanabaenaceae cyanobacterium bins.68]
MAAQTKQIFNQIAKLNEIGKALSAQKDVKVLTELILINAKELLNAEGGTLYLATEEQSLKFEILINDRLGIAMGGTTGVPIPFEPLRLYNSFGQPNNNMVAAYAALHCQTINIADAYEADGFDFSGTRAFDQKTGYRSRSFLTIPMLDYDEQLIGVLQLINAKNADGGEIIAFTESAQSLAESLASQAAIALTNYRLIAEFKHLFESFIELIAKAIDDKSPHTGNHCRRVPELTMMLAEAACNSTEGIFADFNLTADDRYELKIAGMLHDCGKVTTPVHVIEKSTKLETIYDRIDLIDHRFEILYRDAEIELLKAKLQALEAGQPSQIAELEASYQTKLQAWESDRQFLHHCNIGSEFMADQQQQRVAKIAAHTWQSYLTGTSQPLITSNELENLQITKGTLTAAERQIINHHIVVTLEMLEALPYPAKLRRVPEFAGGHHERMDGKGYPKGLTRSEMSIQARIMGIADIFEALTAKDRPYKKGKTITECLQIMGRMKLDHHIDPDIFDLFVRERIYLQYAERFLDPEQIDQVDHSQIPGYGERSLSP